MQADIAARTIVLLLGTLLTVATRAERCWAGELPLVIEGGSIFDSISGTMQSGRTILIEGQQICAIGTPEQPVSLPPHARRIDARGKFIIPGLIDAHVHLVHVLDFAHVTGDEVLPLYLASGVTSVRDTGDEIVAETVIAHFAESHPNRCPRVFLCSPLIDAEPPIHRDIGRAVTDPAQVPALVEDMVGWGVTTLKIYAGTARPVGRRVIEEGHRHGLIVTAHLGNYSAQDSVADGVDCLEHIWSVFNFIIPADVANQPDHRANLDLFNPQAKALVSLLAQRKTMVDPTLVVFRNMIYLNDLEEIHEHADNIHVPERLRSWWTGYRTRSNLQRTTRDARRKEVRKYQELTGILHRAGVPILAGTDAPEPFVPPGLALHQELELLVESGLMPAAALQAATINNARALQKSEQLGSIEVGKFADLVILNSDPTADIRNTRRIEQVIRGGLLCDPKELMSAVSKK